MIRDLSLRRGDKIWISTATLRRFSGINLLVPAYYYTINRRLRGEAMKYPLMRSAHFPEVF